MKGNIKMNKERPFIICECGAKIYGKSIKHAEKLLPEHKRSRIHLERMDAIKIKCAIIGEESGL